MPLGSRLWPYSNFHCNLACDYCCAQSSPKADARLLLLELARTVVDEFAAQGGSELLITGGEPFLHPDLGAIVGHAEQVPVVILTNAMVFENGRRRQTLESLDRDRVTLQVSLDSARPALHDRQRGAGSHARALAGIWLARVSRPGGGHAGGGRARLGRSVARGAHEPGCCPEDRLIRPVAAEGFADEGIHISLDTVEPEPTIAVDGAWGHPVAVTNDHLKIADQPLPLAAVLDVIRDVLPVQAAGSAEGREVFRCT